jgi:hypothetical protein
MKNRLILSLVLALGFSFPVAQAAETDISKCKINASAGQTVSLGFPLRPERLAYKANPKILVIPYRLKDQAEFILTDAIKKVFTVSASNITNFSSGKSSPQFIFNKAIDIALTADEMDAIKNNAKTTYQSDFKNSTYGFVAQAIQNSDSEINFTGIDAVILVGSSKKINAEIAEAMLFSSSLSNPWFTPVKTSEVSIANAVLIYNHLDVNTISHEVMHLYGLTDLYGTQNGPGNTLMMNTNNISLLSLEKWVLGWLPDTNVQCIFEADLNASETANNSFTLDYSRGDQLLIIPTGSETALAVDVVTVDKKTYLNYYSLNNEARPPIYNFFKASYEGTSIDITGHSGVGTYLSSSKMGLLITDNDGKKATLSVFPIKLFFSDSGKKLQNTADANREKYIKLAEQEAAAALKKITITCTKGKLTKKVTDVKPVCPTGYTKK